ncbi:aminomethyltransferase family protein [Rhodococcus pseudokoreensis]|uniref:Aminomethyltransferase family protein n=1 Tax=Rhodococcus pseudokoreensis TaxID=2811421 RepID=A0A974VZL6_9NOCA|nr:aminomethyltransferase family protein [Rhodococcus pseudokoreensis]QSE88144.1 aminomethyltransferase family protein [Rhodococcus pseudokoreensis]
MRTAPEVYAWSRFGQPEYTDWLDESMSWKETCYIGDWSFLWQHRFTGPDALRLFSDISVNSFAKFDHGQSKHLIHTNTNGKVIHEGILTRFGDDDYMLHGRGGFWASYQLGRTDYDVKVQQEDWFIYQVSGPNSVKVLEKVSGQTGLRDTGFMRLHPITVAGHKIWALRQGMSGEIGFELQGPKEYGQEIYDVIVEAGQEFGIRKLGGRVAMINHLEACFPTIATDYIPAIFDEDMAEYLEVFSSSMPSFAQPAYIAGSYDGREISEYYRSPVELGWARNINFDHDFLGRAALEAEKADPRRVIRTLVWDADDVQDVFASLFRPGENYPYMEMPRDQRGFMWADKVTAGDDLVGVATSRGYSYYYRQMLSLSTIDVAHSEPGTELTVHWGRPDGPQKAIRATVAPAPYKPDRRRADLRTA